MVKPFKYKEKTREKGRAGQKIADNLNKMSDFTVAARGVAERFKFLETNLRKKKLKNLRLVVYLQKYLS